MFENRYSYFRFEWSFCCSRASAKTNILRLSSTTNRGSEANSKSDIWGVLWIVRNYFILHWSEFFSKLRVQNMLSSSFFLFFSAASSHQCHDRNAMIQFSVFDKDILTADDFGGETFFPLSAVPGTCHRNLEIRILKLILNFRYCLHV